MDISLKGEKDGLCNRKDCLRPGATWFNHSTRKWYCGTCARRINQANPEHVEDFGYPVCSPIPQEEISG